MPHLKSAPLFAILISGIVTSLSAAGIDAVPLIYKAPEHSYVPYVGPDDSNIFIKGDITKDLSKMRDFTKWIFGVLRLDAIDTSAQLEW